MSPSNTTAFCSRRLSAPRRMASSSVGERAAVGGRPADEKLAERAEQGEIMIARDSGELGGARPGARTVAAHQREKGRERCAKRERGGVGEPAIRALIRSIERNRSTDFAESPQSERQIDHRRRRLDRAGSERPDRRRGQAGTGRAHVPIRARLRQIRRRTVGHALDPMGDAGLGRIRVSPRRRARKAAACALIDGNSPRT